MDLLCGMCMTCATARLSHLETLTSRLPHVWHRREGEWVRVAVAPDSHIAIVFNGSARALLVAGVSTEPGSIHGANGVTYAAHDCYLTPADALHAQHDPPKEGK